MRCYADVDVVVEDITESEWIDEAARYGVDAELLAPAAPAGHWPFYRMSGEREALVKFLCEQYLDGDSVESDLGDAGVEIKPVTN